MRKVIVGVAVSIVLAGCGGVLPHESSKDTAKFQTYDELMSAYAGVVPGKTRLTELPALGLDMHTIPNIEVLSYTDIVNHFLPSESMKLEQAPPAARRCMEAQERCSAYIIHLQNSQTSRNGGVVPDLLGIERDTVKSGWSAKIVLVLLDNVVVYKEISGLPNIEEHNDTSQPLGPLQDLGQDIVGAAPHP